MRPNYVRNLVRTAAIAAIYTAVSLALAPLSYGLIQVRVSEAMSVLPAFTPYAIPGLFIGCLLTNIIGASMGLSTLPDIIFGSLATGLAAYCSYKLRKYKYLVPLPCVLINAVVVGYLLCYVYAVGAPLWMCMLYVAIGQTISAYVIGLPLMSLLNKYKHRLFDH